MGSSPRILVVGYNAWDVNFAAQDFASHDTKYEVERIRLGGGGPGATAAFALARLGAKVQLVTQLGDDLPGRSQYDELTAGGVDLSLSQVVPGFESPKAVIIVHPLTGERAIFWARGDLPAIDVAVVDLAWLDAVDLFYTDGHETAAARKVAIEAAKRGIPVVMDAGSVRPGSAELVESVSDVVSSDGFATALTDCSSPAAALRELRKMGPERVAMTFGPRGVLALVGEAIEHIPAFVVPVVDTTGAGDAFHAGYAMARATGRDFVASLEYGSAVAALKCRNWGGREGLPTAAEVEDLLANGAFIPRPEEFGPLLG